jgi:hypothetical protein
MKSAHFAGELARVAFFANVRTCGRFTYYSDIRKTCSTASRHAGFTSE